MEITALSPLRDHFRGHRLPVTSSLDTAKPIAIQFLKTVKFVHFVHLAQMGETTVWQEELWVNEKAWWIAFTFQLALSGEKLPSVCLSAVLLFSLILVSSCSPVCLSTHDSSHDGWIVWAWWWSWEKSRLRPKSRGVFVCKPFGHISVRKSRNSTVLFLLMDYIKSKLH